MNSKQIVDKYLQCLSYEPKLQHFVKQFCSDNVSALSGEALERISEDADLWNCNRCKFVNKYGIRIVKMAYDLLRALTVNGEDVHGAGDSAIAYIYNLLTDCAVQLPVLRCCFALYHASNGSDAAIKAVVDCASFINAVLLARFQELENKPEGSIATLHFMQSRARNSEDFMGNFYVRYLREQKLELQAKFAEKSSELCMEDERYLNVEHLLEKHFLVGQENGEELYMSVLSYFGWYPGNQLKQCEKYIVSDIFRAFGCSNTKLDGMVETTPNTEFASVLCDACAESYDVLTSQLANLDDIPRREALRKAIAAYKALLQDLDKFVAIIGNYEPVAEIREAFARLDVIIGPSPEPQLENLIKRIAELRAKLAQTEVQVISERSTINEKDALSEQVIETSCQALRELKEAPILFGTIFDALERQNASQSSVKDFENKKLAAAQRDCEKKLYTLFEQIISATHNVPSSYENKAQYYNVIKKLSKFLQQYTYDERNYSVDKEHILVKIGGYDTLQRVIQDVENADAALQEQYDAKRKRIDEFLNDVETKIKLRNDIAATDQYVRFAECLCAECDSLCGFLGFDMAGKESVAAVRALTSVCSKLQKCEYLMLPTAVLGALRAVHVCVLNDRMKSVAKTSWLDDETVCREIETCAALISARWAGETLCKRAFLELEDIEVLWSHALDISSDVIAALKLKALVPAEQSAELDDSLAVFIGFASKILEYTRKHEQQYAGVKLPINSQAAEAFVHYLNAAKLWWSTDNVTSSVPDVHIPKDTQLTSICAELRGICGFGVATSAECGFEDFQLVKQMESEFEALVKQLKDEIAEYNAFEQLKELLCRFSHNFAEILERCCKAALDAVQQHKKPLIHEFTRLFSSFGSAVEQLTDQLLKRAKWLDLREQSDEVCDDAQICMDMREFSNQLQDDEYALAQFKQALEARSGYVQALWKGLGVSFPECEAPSSDCDHFDRFVYNFIINQDANALTGAEEAILQYPEAKEIVIAMCAVAESMDAVRALNAEYEALRKPLLPRVPAERLKQLLEVAHGQQISQLREYENALNQLFCSYTCESADESELIDKLEELAMEVCDARLEAQRKRDLNAERSVSEALSAFGACGEQTGVFSAFRREIAKGKTFRECALSFLEDFAKECDSIEAFYNKQEFATTALRFARFLADNYGFVRAEGLSQRAVAILCAALESQQIAEKNNAQEDIASEKLLQRLSELAQSIDECMPEMTVFCGPLNVRGKPLRINEFTKKMRLIQDEITLLRPHTKLLVESSADFHICQHFQQLFEQVSNDNRKWDIIRDFPVMGAGEIPKMPYAVVPPVEQDFLVCLKAQGIEIQTQAMLGDAHPEILLWLAVGSGRDVLAQSDTELAPIRKILTESSLIGQMSEYFNAHREAKSTNTE